MAAEHACAPPSIPAAFRILAQGCVSRAARCGPKTGGAADRARARREPGRNLPGQRSAKLDRADARRPAAVERIAATRGRRDIFKLGKLGSANDNDDCAQVQEETSCFARKATSSSGPGYHGTQTTGAFIPLWYSNSARNFRSPNRRDSPPDPNCASLPIEGRVQHVRQPRASEGDPLLRQLQRIRSVVRGDHRRLPIIPDRR